MHACVRAAAIVVGFPTAILSIMALLRPLTSSLPLQLGLAAVLGVLLPVSMVLRLFPDRPKREAASISWDVLAIAWVLVATVFVGVLHPYSRAFLGAEANLLSSSGFGHTGHLVLLVAAVRPPADAASGKLPSSKPPAAVVSAPPSPPPTPAPPASPSAALSAPSPVLPRADAPLAIAQIVKRVAPLVVTVAVQRPDGRHEATGFFLAAGGIVATTRTLVDQATAVAMRRHDGTWVRGGQLLVLNDRLDYALLRFRVDALVATAAVSPAATLAPGAALLNVACPLGLGKTQWFSRIVGPAEGYVLALDQDVPRHREGSPVFDRFGDLVGMITMPDRMGRGPFGPQGAVIAIEPILRRLESGELEAKPLAALPARETP